MYYYYQTLFFFLSVWQIQVIGPCFMNIIFFFFQEKKKKSAEELVEIQDLIKATLERVEEVRS